MSSIVIWYIQTLIVLNSDFIVFIDVVFMKSTCNKQPALSPTLQAKYN
jgi:hypothetical protein